MSKRDEILDYLDSGYDHDIEWSERAGSRVFIHYSDGTELTVNVTLHPKAGDSGLTNS